ncbi:MAG: DUF6051 family protein [Spirochaetota bacterium]
MTTVPSYEALYEGLGASFSLEAERTDLEPIFGVPIELHTIPFVSANTNVHPPESYSFSDPTYQALVGYYAQQSPFSDRHFFQQLQLADRHIEENQRFRYLMFSPKLRDTSAHRRATLMLHGLNEKSWHKYLPWAFRLAQETAAPVILFPAAFHLNRAPTVWSNPREMVQVARERQRLFPALKASTFANVALSHRVQFAPHRFLTSSFQSYYDLLDLARSVRGGHHPLLEAGTTLDLFGYSIGASLCELLLLRNQERLFSNSRAFLFCGGSLLDQSVPVSRAIIDDAAFRGLEAYLSRLEDDPRAALPRGIEGLTRRKKELKVFQSLVFLEKLRGFRERAVRKVSARVRAWLMRDDEVFPPDGFRLSWSTERGERLLAARVVEPSYSYKHEQPFPVRSPVGGEAEAFFTELVAAAAEHLHLHRRRNLTPTVGIGIV